jgi:hypothetical protein
MENLESQASSSQKCGIVDNGGEADVRSATIDYQSTFVVNGYAHGRTHK